MSDNEQLIIEINPSRQLLYLLFLLHGLAIVALGSLAIPLPVTFFSILAFVFNLNYYIRKTREITRIVAKSDNEWFVQKSDGSSFTACLSGKTYVSDWLTILVFSSYENSSLTYVHLLSDSVKSPVLSQLKLRLKVMGQAFKADVPDGSHA